MLQMPKTEATSANAKIEEAQKNFNVYKISYEKLRDDVNIKLQFLDENRVCTYVFIRYRNSLKINNSQHILVVKI
jgi:hypothetical protein